MTLDKKLGIVSFFALLSMLACDLKKPKENQILPSSSGKFGEVLVVIDTTLENGKTGEIVNEIFHKAMPAFPQQETQFRMATVTPKGFKSILKRSRNILKVQLKPNSKTAINITNDVWAKNQLLIDITASSAEKAVAILEKNKQTIRDYYNEEELSRLQKQYKKKPNKELMQEVRKRFKINILIPPAFLKMATSEDGLWLKKEKSVGEHQVMQGLSIYNSSYSSDSSFSIREMIKQRNNFCKKHIQGSRDSSYMVVYEDFEPTKKVINLDGLYVVEYRGLWKMENDFMGGPFIHYTFADQEGKKLIHLDGFVYAPKFNKREYLRELEAMMRSAELVSN